MSYRYASLPVEQIRPNAKNTRTHSKKQIRQIAASIRELGFAAPILVDEFDVLIAGHGRLEAARSLGMAAIPAIVSGEKFRSWLEFRRLVRSLRGEQAVWSRSSPPSSLPEPRKPSSAIKRHPSQL